METHQTPDDLDLIKIHVRNQKNEFIGEFEFPIIPQIGDRVMLDSEFPAQRVVDREIDSWTEDYQLEIKIWVKPIDPDIAAAVLLELEELEIDRVHAEAVAEGVIQVGESYII